MDEDERLICDTCHGAGEVRPFRQAEVLQCGPCEGGGWKLCNCGRRAVSIDPAMGEPVCGEHEYRCT